MADAIAFSMLFASGGTITGRMSCKGPNVQTIPKHKLVAMDFATLEMKVAAQLIPHKVTVHLMEEFSPIGMTMVQFKSQFDQMPDTWKQAVAEHLPPGMELVGVCMPQPNELQLWAIECN